MRLILILISSLLFLFCVANTPELDSLLKQDKKLSGIEKVNNLVNISRQYFIYGDTTSRKYANNAITLAREIEFAQGEGMANLFLALSYDGEKNSIAIEHYKLSSDILSKIDHPWLGFCYENTSTIYREWGWYPEALDYSLKALSVYEASGDTVQIAKVMSNIGYINDKIGNHRECISWQKKVLKILNSVDNDEFRGTVYGRIGISYDEMGIYDSAHFYNEKAIELFRKVKSDIQISQWLSNIGNTYIKQEDFNQAENYLKQARKLLTTDERETVVIINIGKVYLETGRYTASEAILDTAIRKAVLFKQKRFLGEAYYRKYELYEKQGHTSKALDFFIKYSALEDSLLNKEKTEQIARMSVRYKTEQKEKLLLLEQAENEKLQKEKVLAEMRLYNRNKWIIGIIGTSLILIFFILFISQRNKRKAQAEKDSAIIKEREKGLKAVFNAQEDERKRIAKDLHDGIGQQISAIKMFFQSLTKGIVETKPELKEDILKVDKMITDTGTDIRTISHQMMPKALTELGLVDAMEDLLENCFYKTKVKYNFENIGFEKRLPSNVEIALYRITQELLQNIIKHSGAKKVDVQLMKMKNHCILIIEDNGKGIPENEVSDGVGMLNINNRLSTINGNLNMDSGEGKGTTATIRIALA